MKERHMETGPPSVPGCWPANRKYPNPGSPAKLGRPPHRPPRSCSPPARAAGAQAAWLRGALADQALGIIVSN